MNEQNPNYNYDQNLSNNDELDFTILVKTFLRNKKLIILTTLISTLLSVLYCYSVKPIWKGNFKILVKDNNGSNIFGNRALENNLLSLNNLQNLSGKSNKTEELILKSPSVLLPVYEYVNNYYKQNNIKNGNKSFNYWVQKDLNVQFKKGTSVFTIEYKGNDKKLILDVLNLISEKYQNYSKRGKEKELRKTLDYLTTQKRIMAAKVANSLNTVNKFSIENGLGDFDGFFTNNMNNINKENLKRLNFQGREISLQNDINTSGMIDSRISKNSANQRFQSQFNLLEKYEAEYMNLSAKLKPQSSYLTELKTKIDNLKKLLKKPSEILITYRDLKNEANRDSELLENISRRLEFIKLEQVKNPDPWLMISTPTIDDYKFFPNKKNITIFSFFFSLLSITFIALIKDKFSSKINDKKLIFEKFKCNYIEKVDSIDTKLNSKLIEEGIKQANKNLELGDVNFINFTSLPNNELKTLFDFGKNINFLDFYSFKDIENNSNICFFIEECEIKYDDIELADKYQYIYKNKFIGWFLFDSKKLLS
tara:strand:- start:2180 stop:3790 length:1611 start_codon:yes stop_codon:yes gene_type:complete